MPRPKPKRASRNFMARGHSLSEPARAILVELLGYGTVNLREESVRHQFPGMKILKGNPGEPLCLVRDPNADTASSEKVDVGKIILEVELVLGIYVDGAQHLDNIPRPADYVAAFKPLEPMAMKLLNTVTRWTEYYRDQFALKGADICAIERSLASILEVTNAVLKDMEGRPSKGARKNNALVEVVRRLRHIFRAKYRGPQTGRRKKGAFQFRAEKEKRELDFVQTALTDARIIPKTYKGLPRLFLDPRCAMPGERAAIVERIAGSANRKREREQKGDIG